MGVLIKFISSNNLIGKDANKTLVKDVENLLMASLILAKLNYILHGSIQHSAQLIKVINNYGRNLSEEALKANIKHLRRYMEPLSRK